MKPLLSIIIPVYKVEKFIDQCLNSIFSQKMAEDVFEVIVVNDGTPDNSMAIVEEYTSHANLIILNQKNQGLSMARNNGLKVCKGEYVWFVDSDDWLLPNSLSEVIVNIKKHPDVNVFSSVLLCVYESTGNQVPEYNPYKGLISGCDYIKRKYRQGAVQRFIFKKSFLDKENLNFYPGLLHEDSLFGFQMLYLANEVFILDHMVYAYRLRESGSIMSSISIKSPNDLLTIHKMLMTFMDNRVKNEDKEWYKLAIYHVIDCVYGFSRGILSTQEFKEFYSCNKQYLRDESLFLKKARVSKIYAYRMIFFPVCYMKFRNYLGRLKKAIGVGGVENSSIEEEPTRVLNRKLCRLNKKVSNKISSYYNLLKLSFLGVKHGSHCCIHGKFGATIYPKAKLYIGNDFYMSNGKQ